MLAVLGKISIAVYWFCVARWLWVFLRRKPFGVCGAWLIQVLGGFSFEACLYCLASTVSGRSVLRCLAKSKCAVALLSWHGLF